MPTSSSELDDKTSFSQPENIDTIKNISDLFEFVKMYDTEFNPNTTSLILNEDGSPKVVYHGSSESFDKFDRTKRSFPDANGSSSESQRRSNTKKASKDMIPQNSAGVKTEMQLQQEGQIR